MGGLPVHVGLHVPVVLPVVLRDLAHLVRHEMAGANGKAIMANPARTPVPDGVQVSRPNALILRKHPRAVILGPAGLPDQTLEAILLRKHALPLAVVILGPAGLPSHALEEILQVSESQSGVDLTLALVLLPVVSLLVAHH